MARFTVPNIRGALRQQMRDLGWAHLDTTAQAELFVRYLPGGEDQVMPILAEELVAIAGLRTVNAAVDAVYRLAHEWHGIADAHRFGKH